MGNGNIIESKGAFHHLLLHFSLSHIAHVGKAVQIGNSCRVGAMCTVETGVSSFSLSSPTTFCYCVACFLSNARW